MGGLAVMVPEQTIGLSYEMRGSGMEKLVLQKVKGTEEYLLVKKDDERGIQIDRTTYMRLNGIEEAVNFVLLNEGETVNNGKIHVMICEENMVNFGILGLGSTKMWKLGVSIECSCYGSLLFVSASEKDTCESIEKRVYTCGVLVKTRDIMEVLLNVEEGEDRKVVGNYMECGFLDVLCFLRDKLKEAECLNQSAKVGNIARIYNENSRYSGSEKRKCFRRKLKRFLGM